MQHWFRLLVVVVVLAASSFVISPVEAQGQAGQVNVSNIRVVGTQRIEVETVVSYLTFKRGDRVASADLDKSLKSLFQTGLFSDVTLRLEGTVVVVNVVENPIINRLAFEGNQRISEEALTGEIQLRPRVVYTRSRVKSDVQRIIDIYRRSGRFAATVEPKVIQLEQNRVDLVFEIDEGDLTEIRQINFVGNREFSDSSLRGVIQTKETAWWRFLTSDDTYDPDRLSFDRELLRRFYLGEGYADFRVVSVVAELAPDKEAFFITFTVEEGERYKFGKPDLTTTLRNLDAEELRQQIEFEEGDWYDADQVEATISALSDAVGTRGFAFVEVKPRVKRDRQKRIITITFDIQEGPKVFVERINITGNVRTVDEVIRRELLLVPGDAFNTSKLRRSRRRIRNLGFFEKVEVENVPGSGADQTVVNVDVREQSTGEISFGAGFSNTSGILGDISLRERNLVGRAQDLRLRLQIGSELQQLDLSFTEPYFMDRPIAAGFDLFRVERDLQDESSFDRDSTGGSLRMGYRLQENLTQRWKYTLRQDEITNVDSTASLAVQQQEGETLTSEVSHTIQFDKRDDRFDPKSGFLISMTNAYAGLIGDVDYVRNDISGAYYVPITEDITGSVRLGGGYIIGLSDDNVRIIDRFFLGGSNLRGFENAGAGPRDIASDDALGGNWVYFGTAELSFPLGLPSEFGIRGRVFSDFGSIGLTDDEVGRINQTESIRLSAGVGLSWRSPFGPVRIDFAQAILKEDFDETELFRFSFGTSF